MNKNAHIFKHVGKMPNWLFVLIAITLVSCTPGRSESTLTVKPNPTNTLALPTNASTPPAALSPSLPPTGWKTFVSDNLAVTIDYPPDWSVNELASGVTFTSPSGISIQLAKVDTGSLSPEEFLSENQIPNTRCSTSVNSYSTQVFICFDTISGSYTADFVVTLSQGTKQLLSMSMLRKGDLQVFEEMAGSVHPSTRP
jgi:hypothetical protein